MKILLLALFLALTNAANEYRLPQTVIPENYKLQILTYLGPEEDNFKFVGDVKIDATCILPTTNITLHSKDLQIDEKSIVVRDISSKASKQLQICSATYNKEMDFLIINLGEPLQQDHKYEISIKYTGKLTDGLAGFYRSSYVDKATKEKRWIAVTQFEATDARKAFPCFDEPAMKATYEISLGRHGNYTTLSNMPLKTTEPVKENNGWFWDHYEKSVPMSTYLVAFLVSDFAYEQAEPTGNDVIFKIWTRKDAINQVSFAKEVGPKCLSYFEKFFDIKYPLPKQDMVAMPDFNAGAMENWGLITYRETALLYDPNVSTTTSQHSISSTICHELAHQWFGNLVTMKWWTDLWLNEGFATYMAGLGVHHLFPQWNSLQEEAADNMLAVYNFDALKNSHPVSVTVGNPSEIEEIFDTISYKKGSTIIRMMGLFLGESTLQKGVSNYLKKHKYNNAEQDDLWQALTEQAHSDGVLAKDLTVKTIMDTWTVQTGYPVLTVNRNYDDRSAEISQERFFRNSAAKPEGNPCWWVPLTYTTKCEANFTSTHPKAWLPCPKKSQTIKNLPGNDEWLIFNNKLSALYKVNYDKKNWELLTETLKSDSYDTIPVLNRVELIDDAADLAWVGELTYDTFFKLLDYVEREREYLPWRTALSNIGSLDRILRRTSMYGKFKLYMKKLLTPIYENIGGFSVKKSEKLDAIKFQVLVTSWACKYGVGECVEEAINLFKQYKDDPESNNVPKDMRRIVYCTAVSRGAEDEWNFLWKQYKKSNVGSEKAIILSTLGCTKQIWLQKRYLDWSIDGKSGIRKQDAATVFATVATNEIGSFIARDFFYDNIQKIYKHISPNIRRLSRYLSAIAGSMNTEREYKDLDEFIKRPENKDIFSHIKQGVEQSLENVQIRVNWRKNSENHVASILSEYAKEEE